MSCKYAYMDYNQELKSNVLYCSNKDNKTSPNGICSFQRYCKDKSSYMPSCQDKMHCKYYEES